MNRSLSRRVGHSASTSSLTSLVSGGGGGAAAAALVGVGSGVVSTPTAASPSIVTSVLASPAGSCSTPNLNRHHQHHRRGLVGGPTTTSSSAAGSLAASCLSSPVSAFPSPTSAYAAQQHQQQREHQQQQEGLGGIVGRYPMHTTYSGGGASCCNGQEEAFATPLNSPLRPTAATENISGNGGAVEEEEGTADNNNMPTNSNNRNSANANTSCSSSSFRIRLFMGDDLSLVGTATTEQHHNNNNPLAPSSSSAVGHQTGIALPTIRKISFADLKAAAQRPTSTANATCTAAAQKRAHAATLPHHYFPHRTSAAAVNSITARSGTTTSGTRSSSGNSTAAVVPLVYAHQRRSFSSTPPMRRYGSSGDGNGAASNSSRRASSAPQKRTRRKKDPSSSSSSSSAAAGGAASSSSYALSAAEEAAIGLVPHKHKPARTHENRQAREDALLDRSRQHRSGNPSAVDDADAIDDDVDSLSYSDRMLAAFEQKRRETSRRRVSGVNRAMTTFIRRNSKTSGSAGGGDGGGGAKAMASDASAGEENVAGERLAGASADAGTATAAANSGGGADGPSAAADNHNSSPSSDDSAPSSSSSSALPPTNTSYLSPSDYKKVKGYFINPFGNHKAQKIRKELPLLSEMGFALDFFPTTPLSAAQVMEARRRSSDWRADAPEELDADGNPILEEKEPRLVIADPNKLRQFAVDFRALATPLHVKAYSVKAYWRSLYLAFDVNVEDTVDFVQKLMDRHDVMVAERSKQVYSPMAKASIEDYAESVVQPHSKYGGYAFYNAKVGLSDVINENRKKRAERLASGGGSTNTADGTGGVMEEAGAEGAEHDADNYEHEGADDDASGKAATKYATPFRTKVMDMLAMVEAENFGPTIQLPSPYVGVVSFSAIRSRDGDGVYKHDDVKRNVPPLTAATGTESVAAATGSSSSTTAIAESATSVGAVDAVPLPTAEAAHDTPDASASAAAPASTVSGDTVSTSDADAVTKERNAEADSSANNAAADGANTNSSSSSAANAPPQPQRITLNKEQLKVIELATKGYNLYIGGFAGTGKTQLLKALRHVLHSRLGLSVGLIATTGMASKNVGGRTLHAHFKMSVDTAIWDRSEILQNDVIIIDEVSMMSGEVLARLDAHMRIRAGHSPLPFAGVQMILCGDFLQLPCIGHLAYGLLSSKLFLDNFVMSGLKTVVRQNDQGFIEHLRGLRSGAIAQDFLDAICVKERVPDGNEKQPSQLLLPAPTPDSSSSAAASAAAGPTAAVAEDGSTAATTTADATTAPLNVTATAAPPNSSTPKKTFTREEWRERPWDCVPPDTLFLTSTRRRTDAINAHHLAQLGGHAYAPVTVYERPVLYQPQYSTDHYLLEVGKAFDTRLFTDWVHAFLTARVPEAGVTRADICLSRMRGSSFSLRCSIPKNSIDVDATREAIMDAFTGMPLALAGHIRETMPTLQQLRDGSGHLLSFSTSDENVQLFGSAKRAGKGGGGGRRGGTAPSSAAAKKSMMPNSSNAMMSDDGATTEEADAPPPRTVYPDGYEPTPADHRLYCVFTGSGPADGPYCPQPIERLLLEKAHHTGAKSSIIKVGAKVMLNANVSLRLVNGTVGTVIGMLPLTSEVISLAVMRHRETAVRYVEGYMAQTGGGLPFVPVVDFGENDPCTLVFPILESNVPDNCGGWGLPSYQFPLRLAYAFTIHKIQGMTLTGRVHVDLEGAWHCDHLLYVAFSRVRNPEQLTVSGFQSALISVDPDAALFDQSLPSPIDAGRFIPPNVFPALWKRFPDLRNARRERLVKQKREKARREHMALTLSLRGAASEEASWGVTPPPMPWGASGTAGFHQGGQGSHHHHHRRVTSREANAAHASARGDAMARGVAAMGHAPVDGGLSTATAAGGGAVDAFGNLPSRYLAKDDQLPDFAEGAALRAALAEEQRQRAANVLAHTTQRSAIHSVLAAKDASSASIVGDDDDSMFGGGAAASSDDHTTAMMSGEAVYRAIRGSADDDAHLDGLSEMDPALFEADANDGARSGKRGGREAPSLYRSPPPPPKKDARPASATSASSSPSTGTLTMQSFTDGTPVEEPRKRMSLADKLRGMQQQQLQSGGGGVFSASASIGGGDLGGQKKPSAFAAMSSSLPLSSSLPTRASLMKGSGAVRPPTDVPVVLSSPPAAASSLSSSSKFDHSGGMRPMMPPSRPITAATHVASSSSSPSPSTPHGATAFLSPEEEESLMTPHALLDAEGDALYSSKAKAMGDSGSGDALLSSVVGGGDGDTYSDVLTAAVSAVKGNSNGNSTVAATCSVTAESPTEALYRAAVLGGASAMETGGAAVGGGGGASGEEEEVVESAVFGARTTLLRPPLPHRSGSMGGTPDDERPQS